MILSSLLTPIVVPPVDLAVAALVAAAFRRRAAALACLAVLVALAMPAVSGPLQAALAVAPTSRPAATEHPQAILVLGGDLARDGEGREVPGALSLGRLREAAILARATGLPVALTGGPLWPGGPPVAAVMARSLEADFLVRPRWVETRSVDTWQNARLSAALLEPLGVSRVLLVTDAWHVRRALLAFRGTGLEIAPAPVRRTGSPGSTFLSGFVPRASAWQQSYFALHEWIGLAWYQVRLRLAR